MKKAKAMLGLVSIVALLGVSGCSALHKSDSAILQGMWKGQEIGGPAGGLCSFIISGTVLEFRGADTKEWYKGTFTLREDTNPRQVVAVITECPFPQYMGKTTHAIYRVEGGTLTVAANEPGNPEVPADFDARGARHFVLRRD